MLYDEYTWINMMCCCYCYCCCVFDDHAYIFGRWSRTKVQWWDSGPNFYCWDSCPRGVRSYDEGIQILWWESRSIEPVEFKESVPHFIDRLCTALHLWCWWLFVIFVWLLSRICYGWLLKYCYMLFIIICQLYHYYITWLLTPSACVYVYRWWTTCR